MLCELLLFFTFFYFMCTLEFLLCPERKNAEVVRNYSLQKIWQKILQRVQQVISPNWLSMFGLHLSVTTIGYLFLVQTTLLRNCVWLHEILPDSLFLTGH